jgi:hypothetical protein
MSCIHTQLKEAGIKLDGGQSDLYAEKTPVSEKILEGYQWRENVRTFHSQTDGKVWYDIPFANKDFWDKRRGLKCTKKV